MKKSNRFTMFSVVLAFLLTLGMPLVCGTAMGQDEGSKEEFMLEDVVVTSQFTETDLQKTPISITAVTGEMLEKQNILNMKDLGRIIPNAVIREQGNASGPNTSIFLRGVGYGDFIPAIEPGVGVYVDDVYIETIVSSMMDLVDIERVEVLRGPQGTLSGKNNLGGSIRIISKKPNGDNSGHIQVEYGDWNQLDFQGSYDFSVIEDKLFARISASSRRIGGYMDVLDFTCEMHARGTPEKAGSFPSTIRSNKSSRGDCKIGEKGGRVSDAAKLVLRYLPTDKLEINFGIDYTETEADPSAETLLKGQNPDPNAFFNMFYVLPFFNQYANDLFNKEPGDAFSMLGDDWVTGSYFQAYESYYDPMMAQPGYQLMWPRKSDEVYKNWFAHVDYDITDTIHLKTIIGYREYQQIFATTNFNPLSNNAYLVDMEHEQYSAEVRLTGVAFDERLDWTVGAYYFDSDHWYGGNVTLGAFGPPWMFLNNDTQQNQSESAFAHGIFSITDELSVTAGIRFTRDDKTVTVDHTDFATVEAPYNYKTDFSDWKLSLNYEFTDDIMAYIQASTGYRSPGSVARPWNPSQLGSIGNEDLLAYELGGKMDFFDNRLRVNAAVFYQEYDPRIISTFGFQCNDWRTWEPGDVNTYVFPWPTAICPEGTDFAGGPGDLSTVYLSAPGTSEGLELEIYARPIDGLDINASYGYYSYETEVGPGDPGYIHPDYKLQAEHTANLGAQYSINFENESMLIPRVDVFYEGERNNNTSSRQPLGPAHEVPSYTRVDARLTYVSADLHWSLSLGVENLLDKLYWISKTQEMNDDYTDIQYPQNGQPGRPRTVSLTLRYDIF